MTSTDAPARPAPAHSSARRPDIQGLRAIAVLVVVLFHAGLPLPGGFVGVDVFFVISGFVIAAMLHREWSSTGRIGLGSFYLRRFKRLTPALALTVVVTLLLALVIMPPFEAQRNAALTGIGAMALVANIVIARTTGGYFDVDAELNPLLHTWSLSVEEQFYLVFPALLVIAWLVARRAPRLRWMPLAAVALLGLASFAVMMVEARGSRVPWIPELLTGYYGPISRAWEFAAGALLALACMRMRRLPTAVAAAAGAVGASALLASLWLIDAATVFPGPMTVLPVAATMLLLFAGTAAPNPVSAFLSTQPFTWVGDRSYSWYLWHWPFIVFAALIWPRSPVAIAVAGALSLLPAMASYRWVEQPVRTLPTPSAARIATVIGCTLVPTFAIAVFSLWATSNALWNPTLQRFKYAIDTAAVNSAAGCQTLFATGPRDGQCVWNGAADGPPLYLVGDSRAGQYSSAVIGAGVTLSRPVTIGTAPSCPYADVFVSGGTTEDWTTSNCRRWFTSTQEWLTAAPPGLVVISNSPSPLLRSRDRVGATREDMTTDPTLREQIYTRGLTSAVATLQAAGHTVLLVAPNPSFAWNGQRCTTIRILGGDCNVTISLERMLRTQKPAADVVSAAAAGTETSLLDIRPQLCPDGQCRAVDTSGTPITRDGGHISVPISEQLAGTFTAAIEAASR